MARRWQDSKHRTYDSVRRRREELLKILAPDGRCALCRRRPRATPLEIDHVDGRTWEKLPSQLNRHSRIAHYWRDYNAGVRLRALCKGCNTGYRPPGRDARGHRIHEEKPGHAE